MSLTLVNEIWKLIKPSIDPIELDNAAESLVHYLIEEGDSPTELKAVFRGDPTIKKALEYFLESPNDGLYHEVGEDDDDDDDEEEDYYGNDDWD